MFCMGIINLVRIKIRPERPVKTAFFFMFGIVGTSTLHHAFLIESFNYNLGQTKQTLCDICNIRYDKIK